MNTDLIARLRDFAKRGPGYGPAEELADDAATALEAAQPKEPMVTSYVSQTHFDRTFPDVAAQLSVKLWRKPGDDIPMRPSAQPAREPVGQVTEDGFPMLYGHKPLPPGTRLYTHPAPQVPMTDVEIENMLGACRAYWIGKHVPSEQEVGQRFARAVESHHGISNAKK